MAYTFSMIAPGAGLSFTAQSGTTYTADASGLIQNVASNDVNGLEAVGCQFSGSLNIPILTTQFRLSSGAALGSSAAASSFGLQFVPGSSIVLIGELASSNTKTDYALTEITLPNAYLTGSPFNIIVNAQYTSSGSTSSCTIVPILYKTPNSAVLVSSENLVLTGAQQLTSSAADYVFLCNGAPSSGNLIPVQRLLLQLTGAITNSSGTNTMWVNSVRFNIA